MSLYPMQGGRIFFVRAEDYIKYFKVASSRAVVE